jgi:hypothetical protein
MSRTFVAPLLALVLVAALVPALAAAQADRDLGDAGEAALRQLSAFRRDDFDSAYTFASAMIKGMFDRAAFEAMVRNGYPEIARSASARITDAQLAPDASSAVLTLRVRGANGVTVEALYEMIRENGSWRVNGVVTHPDTSEKA